MENTIEQKTFHQMKADFEKAKKGFQDQLEEKKALHLELSKKASKMMDGEYNIDVYSAYTDIGIEKYQLEREMEILNYQIESMCIHIDQTNKIIETENLIKKQDEEIAKMVEFSTQQLAEIEKLEQN